jgi:hypothetical protein
VNTTDLTPGGGKAFPGRSSPEDYYEIGGRRNVIKFGFYRRKRCKKRE